MELVPGLGCRAEGQHLEVGLIGRGAVKARVWAPAVVEVQITANRITGVGDAVVGPQIDLLVLDAAPLSGTWWPAGSYNKTCDDWLS